MHTLLPNGGNFAFPAVPILPDTPDKLKGFNIMPELTFDTGFTLTDAGRAALHGTPDLRPTIRRAYKQAASNGNGPVCDVLEGILPDVEPVRCRCCDTTNFCNCED